MNPEIYRKDFPILNRKLNGKPVIYLDSACVALKPVQVIDAMDDYYRNFPGCGGRSVHKISTQVTIKCDEAREKIGRLINAESEKEMVFCRNATEGINTVARGFGLKKGDIVILTDKEHNSNLVPWHRLRDEIGIKILIAESKKDNTFDMELYKKLLSRKPKLISFYHSSNLDGYTLPAKEIISAAHDSGAKVMLDGAQSVPHMEIDVRKLGVDFLAFSVHKMCGPSGVGVLYGKYDLLKNVTPLITGGENVANTTYESSALLPPPKLFEGGLQNYAGIIGAGAAADYIKRVGLKNIEEHEHALNGILTRSLSELEDIELIGPADPGLRGGIYSFNIRSMQPHDVAMILDESANIMLRSGMQCVHSWYNARGINGSARASFYFYNTETEIKALAENIKKLVKDFCG